MLVIINAFGGETLDRAGKQTAVIGHGDALRFFADVNHRLLVLYLRPLEGYGCTECAPAVAVNTHDFRAAGFRQVGAKRGKIGHPLPGVSVRIVDVEAGPDSPGLPVGPGIVTTIQRSDPLSGRS
jgi:acyl-CoA synthetase (AMP-forming)/AMP-acid ligase II